MESKAILDRSAEAYAKLQSLAVEVLVIHESADDGSLSRNEHRSRAYYAAPAQVRLEQSGRHGMVTVSDGSDLHMYLSAVKRYSKRNAVGRDTLPGAFQPEFPVAGGPSFLFRRIAENVAESEVLREETLPVDGRETPCHVVRVRYGTEDHLLATFSPVTFWVDTRTYLVLRSEGESTHRMPAQDETHTSKQTMVFTRVRVDEPIPPETFQYTPPSDAIDESMSGCGGLVGSRGGSGFASYGPDRRKRVEHWGSHEWVGETLVEHSKWRLRDLELDFERRLTFSENGKDLHIVEKITGPKGETQREISIPME